MPTTVEFTSWPSKAFVAVVKDPMNNYAVLQSGITVTQVAYRRYSFTTNQANRLVWVEVEDGPVSGVGFADLRNLNMYGVAEVLGDAYLAATYGKSSLIGTGNATVSAPVPPNGLLIAPIIIGDDYKAVDNRAFVWTVPKPTSFVAATSKCYFGCELNNANKFTVEGGVPVDNGNGTITLSFDLLRTVTQDLSCGSYRYSVSVHDANGVEVTRIHSLDKYVALVRKYT
jgi:hypothetical protein